MFSPSHSCKLWWNLPVQRRLLQSLANTLDGVFNGSVTGFGSSKFSALSGAPLQNYRTENRVPFRKHMVHEASQSSFWLVHCGSRYFSAEVEKGVDEYSKEHAGAEKNHDEYSREAEDYASLDEYSNEAEDDPENQNSQRSDADENILVKPAIRLEDNISETSSSIRTTTLHVVYVCNLSKVVKSEDLKELFSEYGNVLHARVRFDITGGKLRCFGFVHLSSQDEVKSAIAALKGKEFHKRRLDVRESKLNNQTSLGTFSRKPSDSSYQLYVGNLPRFIRVKDLEELFTQYGTVKDVRFIFECKGEKSRVYGFIQLSSQTEVESAISALSGKIFNDRILVVHEANVEHQA